MLLLTPEKYFRFNSRAPRGARQEIMKMINAAQKFQFTCPSRSTTGYGHTCIRSGYVSIHVPLAEHDSSISFSSILPQVSIHVPLAEHDVMAMTAINRQSRFNSRAPRGARLGRVNIAGKVISCNSRAPRGARHIYDCDKAGKLDVSIHVPLAEHDA